MEYCYFKLQRIRTIRTGDMANVYKIIYRHDILDINSCFETTGSKTLQHETLMLYVLNNYILKYNG